MKGLEPSSAFIDLQNFIVNSAIPDATEVKFNKNSPIELAIVNFYSSSLELSWSMLTLIERDTVYHCHILLRSLLEVCADLTILSDDPTYLDSLRLQDLRSDKASLVAAKGGNPYLAKIKREIDIDAGLSKIGRLIKDLERRGVKVLEPAKKYEKAKMNDESEALHRYLSGHVHSGLGALYARHTQPSGDGDFSVVGFRTYSCDDFDGPLLTARDAVHRASLNFHEFFNTKRQEKYRKIIVEGRAS